jgi:hypothetical protein
MALFLSVTLKDRAFINGCAQLVNPDRQFIHHTTFPDRKSTSTYRKSASALGGPILKYGGSQLPMTTRRAVLLGARLCLGCLLLAHCAAGADVISVHRLVYEHV